MYSWKMIFNIGIFVRVDYKMYMGQITKIISCVVYWKRMVKSKHCNCNDKTYSYSVIAYFLKKEISCQIKLFLRRIAVCNQTQGKIPEISITITYDTQQKLSTRKNKDDSAK